MMSDLTRSQVLVTGPKGPIADAVVRLLRKAGHSVTTLQRGEDIAGRVSKADAIVALDATSAETSDYAHVLAAILAGEDDGREVPVTAITLVPAQASRRKSFLDEARVAEALLSESGHPLTVIRSGLVVGEPTHPGPIDNLLFGKRGWVLIPGDGTAKLRPILLDDLGQMVVASVRDGDQTRVLRGEGAEETTVENLLSITRPGARVIHASPRLELVLRFAVTAVGLVPALLTFPQTFGGADAYGIDRGPWPTIVLALVLLLLIGTAIPWFSIVATSRVLPSEDFLLGEESSPEALGLEPRRLSEVWNAGGHRRRQDWPKRSRGAQTYARLRATYAITLFLVIFGALAVIGAVHDIASPSGLGPKLAALILLLGGITMLFGGAVLLTRWSSRYAFAFLGSLVAIVTTVVVPMFAAVNPDGPWWVYLGAIYVLMGAVGCALSLARLGSLDVFNFMSTSGLKVLGSVLLGGTVAALVQVVYSSVYVPSTVTPKVAVEATLKSGAARVVGQGAKGSRRLPVTLTVKLRNVSRQPLIILAGPYAIYASRRSPTNRMSPRPTPISAIPRVLPLDVHRNVYARSTRRVVVAYGALVRRETTMEPGEQLVRHLALLIAPGWDAASIRGDFVLARRRYDASGAWSSHRQFVEGVRVVDAVSEVNDRPWLHRLTRSKRYVHVQDATGYALPCDGHPAIHAYIGNEMLPNKARWCKEAGRLEEHYGITYGTFTDEVLLPARP